MTYDYSKDYLKDTDKQTSLFRKVIEKEVQGDKILKAFMTKSTKTGFYLSDSYRSMVGILTEAKALLTMLTVRDFGISVSDYLNVLFGRVEYVLDSIYGGNTYAYDAKNKNYVFDSSPFVNADNDDQESTCDRYVNTMTVVFSAFVKLRAYLVEWLSKDKDIKPEFTSKYFNSYSELLVIVETDIAAIMEMFVDQAIILAEPVEYSIDGMLIKDRSGVSQIKYCGWTFDRVDKGNISAYESSMYCSYLVTDAYMHFYVAFEKEIYNSRKNIVVKKPSAVQEYNIAFFNKIKDLYQLFNKTCYDVGHYVDYKVRQNNLDLATVFVSNQFDKVSYAEIYSSTTNDALFNTLFIINIMVNAGIDLDYKSLKRDDEFYETIQHAVQNISRCYKRLQKAGRDFIVEDLILNFNENLIGDQIKKGKLLRQHRILALSLQPFIITTYSLASQYLINYPQRIMQDYLSIIMQNRTVGKKGAISWYWDEDEYHINTNYTYIKALYDFYTYYENYELPFTKDEEVFNKNREKVEAEYALKAGHYQDEIEQLRKELEEQKLRKEPVVKEIETIIASYLEESFDTHVNKYLKQVYLDNSSQDPVKNSSAYVIKRIVGSYFHEMIKDTINVDELTAREIVLFEENSPKLKETKGYIRAEEQVLNQLQLLVGKSLNDKL